MNKQEAVSIPYRVHVMTSLQLRSLTALKVSIPYRVHVMLQQRKRLKLVP